MPVGTIFLISLFSGLALPLGGWLAAHEKVLPRWLINETRHFVLAMAGGVLLGAITMILVPEGMHAFDHPTWSVIPIIIGGVFFFLFERNLARRAHEAPQMMAMLLDFVPESLALGGLAAISPKTVPILALMIGVQNLPEGFNAYREVLCRTQCKSSHALWLLSLAALCGPISAVLGFYFLADQVTWLGAVMLFASGGIMYLVFQDIAPQAKLNRHWTPALGAVFGFALAVFSKAILS